MPKKTQRATRNNPPEVLFSLSTVDEIPREDLHSSDSDPGDAVLISSTPRPSFHDQTSTSSGAQDVSVPHIHNSMNQQAQQVPVDVTMDPRYELPAKPDEGQPLPRPLPVAPYNLGMTPVQQAEQGVYKFGLMDNENVFNMYFGSSNPFSRGFILRKVSVPPFLTDSCPVSGIVITIAELIAIGRQLKVQGRVTQSDTVQIITGEVFCPNMSVDRFLDQANSRARLVEYVSALFEVNNQPHIKTDYIIPINEYRARCAIANMTAEEAMGALVFLANSSNRLYRSSRISFMCEFIAALSTRGTVTTGKLNKMQQGLSSAGTDKNIVLNSQNIQSIWNFIKDVMSDVVAREIFERWSQWINPEVGKIVIDCQASKVGWIGNNDVYTGSFNDLHSVSMGEII